MKVKENVTLTHNESAKLFIKNAENFAVDDTQKNSKLFGRTFIANFDTGNYSVSHSFNNNGKTLEWEILTGEYTGKSGSSPYQSFEIRQNISIVMFKPNDNESVMLSIDDNNNVIYGFLGRYSEEFTGTKLQLLPIASSLANKNTDTEIESTDLSDTSFTLKYANGAAIYKHRYINPFYITWQCFKGTSQYVVDTESYFAFKLAPKVYMVAWNEKVAPLQLRMVFDFEKKKEYATIFCYNDLIGKAVQQFTTGDIEDIILNGKKI